jgi:hypothetical protein
MVRPSPWPRARALTLVLLAAAAIAGLLLFGGLAHAEGPGPGSTGGTRVSGINLPLALAGLAFLSTGLLVLARSRPYTVRAPRLVAAGPAVAMPAMPGAASAPPPGDAASLAPLAAVAGALHATAGALDAIAGELAGPAADTVAVSAERVREAQITLARWLENRR